MDKIEKYRASIKKVLYRHAGGDSEPKAEEYDSQVILDDSNGHYLLMGVGWENLKRIHGISIHIDLKGDKVWIQSDWTEPGVAGELMKMGVPKSDIVLGFHAPYRRPFVVDYAPA